ncbi:YbjQ family protein [Nonomuraea spiralis]|uniref:YbjQ family protein n=1 Tax=Nonomuraea TaxID=83681 RepID=UPI00163BE16B|nr:heavy metal-binding domain-containing protein [Nonomuraea sp. WAC 01424]
MTIESLPGYEIQAVYDHVTGLVADVPGAIKNWSNVLDELGRPTDMPRELDLIRHQATSLTVHKARQLGANAIIGLRYESVHAGVQGWAGICAYGTAVWAQPVSAWARQQYGRMTEAGTVPPLP